MYRLGTDRSDNIIVWVHTCPSTNRKGPFSSEGSSDAAKTFHWREQDRGGGIVSHLSASCSTTSHAVPKESPLSRRAGPCCCRMWREQGIYKHPFTQHRGRGGGLQCSESNPRQSFSLRIVVWNLSQLLCRLLTLACFVCVSRVKVSTKTDGSVNIHPKSVNVEETEFHYNWLVYHLKMRTSSVSDPFFTRLNLNVFNLFITICGNDSILAQFKDSVFL